MRDDLLKSGLDPSDIKARAIDSVERAATNIPHSVQGYAIPYFDLYGHPLPFYRVRAFNHIPKYKQPKETPNHVYFPPGFYALAQKTNYVMVTEGEKKAALAVKLGFPCIALSGVDCWRNRIIVLPLESELSQNTSKGILKAKVPPQTEVADDSSGNLATGMQEFIDYVALNHKTVIFCFDSDEEIGVKPSVQRAAAVFGFELRFRGIAFSKIRQVVLPPLGTSRAHESNTPEEVAQLNKVALDDYLVEKGRDAFQQLLTTCLEKKSAFPRHPSIRDFINKKLQKPNMSRKDVQALAIAVLSDLDANGLRIRSAGDAETYYFDYVLRKLFKTTFSERAENVAATPFGQFMYRRYGLGGADQRLIIWIATQFAAEDPIEDASPFHVIARTRVSEDAVNYQVSDSQFVRVDSDGIELFDNGEGSILFESGGVLPLDTEKLLVSFESGNVSPIPNRWADVLSNVRLRDQDKSRIITSLLYYMSPWLYRWRGMQLPVELVIGESGSGKSTLCELRLSVLSGAAKLRNAPTDLKDWHASIANSGGLHVTDNVQLVDRNLRQRLSDEICRIITEPEPTIEQRKLYTNTDLVRIPIRAVFAITAIQQPFQNADLLQRAMILELDKTAGSEDGIPQVMYDSEWKQHQLERFGGREGWIAHHLVVLHRFFKLVKAHWDPKYRAKHRLIHFEQSMMLMGRVFGIDTTWIPAHLAGIVDKTLGETDWTFEGIRTFADDQGAILYHGTNSFTCQDISSWAQSEDDFKDCDMLTNPRRLAKYMQTHKSIIAMNCQIVESIKRNNRQTYKMVVPKKK